MFINLGDEIINLGNITSIHRKDLVLPHRDPLCNVEEYILFIEGERFARQFDFKTKEKRDDLFNFIRSNIYDFSNCYDFDINEFIKKE